ITAAQKATYMGGAKEPEHPPWMYAIKYFRDDGTGFVIESDPNWWLVEEGKESQYMLYGTEKGSLIPLRSPVLQPDDSGIDYAVKDGKMYGKSGGLLNTGKVSFIITAEGNLLIGHFHTGLSKGNATIMAGELM